MDGIREAWRPDLVTFPSPTEHETSCGESVSRASARSTEILNTNFNRVRESGESLARDSANNGNDTGIPNRSGSPLQSASKLVSLDICEIYSHPTGPYSRPAGLTLRVASLTTSDVQLPKTVTTSVRFLDARSRNVPTVRASIWIAETQLSRVKVLLPSCLKLRMDDVRHFGRDAESYRGELIRGQETFLFAGGSQAGAISMTRGTDTPLGAIPVLNSHQQDIQTTKNDSLRKTAGDCIADCLPLAYATGLRVFGNHELELQQPAGCTWAP